MRSHRACFNLLLASLVVALISPPLRASETPAAAGSNPSAAAESASGGSADKPSPTEKSSKDGKSGDRKRRRKPKPITALRVHVEARRDLPQRSLPARVGRSNPLNYNIEKLPILIEQNVERVTVLDQPGGFQVRVKYDSTGTRLLESYTAAAAGRHLIVATEIDGETRWLAAPLVRHRIADGVLSFSPDATREEMERMVHDLEAAQRKEKRNRWIP